MPTRSTAKAWHPVDYNGGMRITRLLSLVLMTLILGCSGPKVVRPSAPAKMPTEPGTFSRMPQLN
jgi:hypothetical protein